MQTRTLAQIAREVKGNTKSDSPKSGNRESVTALKNPFISSMAYQIRTLSNAIIGFSDLLRQEEDLSETHKEYVNEIYWSGLGMVSLMNDVLDLSRQGDGTEKSQQSDCSIAAVLDEIGSLVKSSAEEKGLQFKILQDTDLPEVVRTDSVRLRQALLNLIGNAIKNTNHGHVIIRIKTESEDEKTWIRFDIEDSGMGIPADKIEGIFNPYSGYEEVNEEMFMYVKQGVMVYSGIAVTNQLVRLMLNGYIDIVSEPGKGTIYSLVIPAGVNISSTPSMKKYSREKEITQKKYEVDNAKCSGHILLVEDQPSNQTVITLLLETMDLGVTVANDGVEAVTMASENNYDLILMDLKMPNMNGYEATRILREKGLVTPIIALSAGDHTRQDIFDDFIAKPVDRQSLFKMISKYLPVTGTDQIEIPDQAKFGV